VALEAPRWAQLLGAHRTPIVYSSRGKAGGGSGRLFSPLATLLTGVTTPDACLMWACLMWAAVEYYKI
jgi:hypothetical protein